MSVLERLFSPQGRPAPTMEQRRFLREARRRAPLVDEVCGELELALEREDVAIAAAACRRLLAVALQLREAANALDYPAAGRGGSERSG